MCCCGLDTYKQLQTTQLIYEILFLQISPGLFSDGTVRRKDEVGRGGGGEGVIKNVATKPSDVTLYHIQESFRGIPCVCRRRGGQREHPSSPRLAASVLTRRLASQCMREHTQNALVPLQARVNHTDPVSTRCNGHTFNSNVLKPKLN
jgi:hypothetical protein